MASPFDRIDAVFLRFAARCAGSAAAALVTVLSINPDTHATLFTATNVTALKRTRRRQPFGVGAGGTLPGDDSRFVLRAADVTFDARTLKAGDRVIDNSGVTWEMENVTLIAFHKLVICDVVKKR